MLNLMHRTDHSKFRKRHDFVPDFSHAERRTRIVIGVTAAMMIVEIVAGLMSHSMALLADGWHMSTHVLAFLITAVAYYFARTQAGNARFSFGTGKIGVLGGFTSAVVLAIVAFLMAGESVRRLFVPLEIHFNEAIGIACIGLLVNLGCALLLADRHHEHDGGSAHQHDLNLRAAYLHVLADAFTSVLAITALTGGKFFGWAWLDPVVGIVGSGVVFSWAYTLLRADSLVTDLHVWQVGIGKYAAMVSIVAHEPKSCDSYRALLRGHKELVHVTIETHLCREDHASIPSP